MLEDDLNRDPDYWRQVQEGKRQMTRLAAERARRRRNRAIRALVGWALLFAAGYLLFVVAASLLGR